MDPISLSQQAAQAQQFAYAPYSGVKVGAALLGDDGRVYTGCNMENASFGATICAERAAVCKAVSSGVTRFTAIAVTSSLGVATFPCGICRQVLAEFSPQLDVVLVQKNGELLIRKLSALLPDAFVLPLDG